VSSGKLIDSGISFAVLQGPLDEFARLSDLTNVNEGVATGDVNTDSGTKFGVVMAPLVQAALLSFSDTDKFGDNVFSSLSPMTALHAKNWQHEFTPFVRDTIASTSDIRVQLKVVSQGTKDLPSSLFPVHETDLTADATPVLPFDLTASLNINLAVDLPAILQTIPSVDLPTFVGAHPPEDLSAAIAAHLPVDLPGFLRPGDSDTHDLSADLQQVGAFVPLGGFLRPSIQNLSDLTAKIIVRCPVGLGGSIHGFVESNLSASLITQRIRDMRAIIRGFAREVERNLGGILRIATADTLDLSVEPFKAGVSTHTSDNPFNLDRVQTAFFENKFLFGSHSGGAFRYTFDPVFGTFPDLHASINARQFYLSDLDASIRASHEASADIVSSATAVTSALNINKIQLTLRPLKNLTASITQRGGFIGLRTLVTGVVKASTSTSDDAGFSTTRSSYRFLLGTTGGLVIPEKNVPVVVTTTYFNSSKLPDLHASIQGWIHAQLSASIKVYEFTGITASLNVHDATYMGNLGAQLSAFKAAELTASITSSGEFFELSSDITVGGGVSDLSSFIQAYVNPLSYNVVPVSTKPFHDLSATINYEAFVRCAVSSQVSEMSAYIRPLINNSSDSEINLNASLNALRIELDLGAAATARKRTRIRTLTLNFRTGSRSSRGLQGIATPKYQINSSLSSSIVGLSHTFDLPSSLTPVRHRVATPDVTLSELVVDLDNPDSTATIMVSFRSAVSSYVYEEITSKVYVTDKGTWALDLRNAPEQGGFSDLIKDIKTLKMDDVIEYFSLDEAIRAGIVILTEQRKVDIAATISTLGQIGDLNVDIGITAADMLANLKSSITTVGNIPDLTASINEGLQSSAFGTLAALVKPQYKEVPGDMTASIEGSILKDLSASLTVS
jgi:hypothetical protein